MHQPSPVRSHKPHCKCAKLKADGKTCDDAKANDENDDSDSADTSPLSSFLAFPGPFGGFGRGGFGGGGFGFGRGLGYGLGYGLGASLGGFGPYYGQLSAFASCVSPPGTQSPCCLLLVGGGFYPGYGAGYGYGGYPGVRVLSLSICVLFSAFVSEAHVCMCSFAVLPVRPVS